MYFDGPMEFQANWQFAIAGLIVGALLCYFRPGFGKAFLATLAFLYVLTFAPAITEFLFGPGGGMIGGLIYLSGVGLIALLLLQAKVAYFLGGMAILAVFDLVQTSS